MRLSLALVLLAIAPLAFAKKPAADAEGVQFIDRSVVSYPKEHGGHTLRRAEYNAAQLTSGVSLDYQLADVPSRLQFNIYVYPLGRGPENDALSAAMTEIEGAIRQFEKEGKYVGVQFGEVTAMEVPAPVATAFDRKGKQPVHFDAAPEAAAGSAAAQDATAAVAPAQSKEEFEAEMVRRLATPSTLTGRRRLFSLTRNEEPVRSLAYIFYSQLFLIKVRASVPASAMAAEAFNASVDAAVTDLVPQISVANYGTCGTMTVSMPPSTGDKEKDAQANALQLVSEMGRIQRENCANSGPEKAAPSGREQQVLVYPANTWK